MVRDVVIPLTPIDAIYLHEIVSKVCGYCNLHRKFSGDNGTLNGYKKFYNDCDLQDTCKIYQKYVVPLGKIMINGDDVVYLTLSQHSAYEFISILSHFCDDCHHFFVDSDACDAPADKCLIQTTIECVKKSLKECENNG